MKDLILKKSGIGLLAVLLLSIAIGVYATNAAKVLITQMMPVVQSEVAVFLPVTIEKGAIVAPKDTVITKDYADGQANVVLDTRVDNFEPSALKKEGAYISKKYAYIYNGRKMEIYSLENFPDMVIDQEIVAQAGQYAEKLAGKIVFLTVFIIIALFVGVFVLLATILMHWLMALLFHVNFAYTLRINTLTYCIIFALSAFTSLNFSFLISFVILIAANVGVNTLDKA